ncbi:MAG TPA: glycosyltransferase family 39 protein, partial [Gemmatimonadaceae bacterium]|nr:glycosyltransferase family 39 protein [Gemmatimonadaceae bacterium]
MNHDLGTMEQGDKATNDQSRVPLAIAITAMVVGIALRVVEFSRDRPLWLDEAMLALNIATRSFADLARPLDYDQTAPLLYLWIERAFVAVGGVNERTLRLLPFLASVALVPAVWLIGRRLAGTTAAAVATALAAISLALVTFSAEAKQYGVDPLCTLMAVGLAARVAAAPEDERRWRQLLAGGVIALFASQPAVFALGGVVLALVSHPRARGTAVGRRWLTLSAL